MTTLTQDELSPPMWSDRYVAELFLNREMRASRVECGHEAWVSLGRVCDAIARGNEAGARDQLVILAVLLKTYTGSTCAEVLCETTRLNEGKPFKLRHQASELAQELGGAMASNDQRRLQLVAGFALLLAARGGWA